MSLTSKQKTAATNMYSSLGYDSMLLNIKQAQAAERKIKAYKCKWNKYVGHYWSGVQNSWAYDPYKYIMSISPERVPKKFTSKNCEYKYSKECARLWAKGKIKEAQQYYDFIRTNKKYDYTDLLTKSLAGILTKQEVKAFKKWKRWKDALNGV